MLNLGSNPSGRRERRYRLLAADAALASRTHFFAAAMIVSRALATGERSSVLDAIGATLEAANLARARAIRCGDLYSDGAPLENTRDFVRFEQQLFQRQLDLVRELDEPLYRRAIDAANEQIRLATRGLARWRNREFSMAVLRVQIRLGRRIDFARQDDREALGVAIAEEAIAQGS